MRVLLAGWHNGRHYGGLEVHLKRVFHMLKESFDDLQFLVSYPVFDSRMMLRKEDIIAIPLRSKPAEHLKAALEYSSKLASWIKRHDVDVLHTHDWLSINAAKILKKDAKNTGWVHTHHSLWFARQLFEHPEDRVKEMEIYANDADYIFTVSKLMKKSCLQRGLSVDNVVYSGGAIDFRNNPETSSEFLLYAGRLSKVKGVDLLLVAFAKYVNEAESPLKLIITGEGELRERVKYLIRMLKLERFVDLRGFVDERTLKALYLKCAAFLHPAYFEPYGISLVDAAEISKPIICSKNCGALEVIENVQTIERNDVSSLVKALMNLDLYRNTELDSKRASWNKVAKIYVDSYLSVA